LELGEELNYDYESDWEDVEESSSTSPDLGQGDNQGDTPTPTNSAETNTDHGSTNDTDDFITETDKLLATIRKYIINAFSYFINVFYRNIIYVYNLQLNPYQGADEWKMI